MTSKVALMRPSSLPSAAFRTQAIWKTAWPPRRTRGNRQAPVRSFSSSAIFSENGRVPDAGASLG
jgi:hypothetical protein